MHHQRMLMDKELEKHGHRDAINGEPANDRCGSSHSNDYCTAYKMAYNIEYYWTSLVQDPR